MIADHAKISLLLKTARGQIDGILRMIEEDRYCIDVSNQMQATSSILKKAQMEVLKAHIQGCVKDSFDSGSPENRDQKIAEVLDLLEKASKQRII